MEFLNTVESRIPSRKRSLDNCDDRCLKELKKRRGMGEVVRDFPPGCRIKEAEGKPVKISEIDHSNSNLAQITSHGNDGKLNISPREIGRNKSPGKVKFWEHPCKKGGYGQQPKVTTSISIQKKPMKNSDNVDTNIKKIVSNDKEELMKLKPSSVEISKPKASEPKELGRNRSYLDSRSTPKVKYWDPACSKEAESEAKKEEAKSGKEEIRREEIKQAMRVFDQVYEPLYRENRLKPKGEKIASCRFPFEVAKMAQKKLKWADPAKVVGHVCGVQVGDRFQYRSQLIMIGLHCQPHSGIDFANIRGKNLAISIVDAHRYSNESRSTDTLVYTGHGGLGGYTCNFGPKPPPEDQKLEKGNLALKNSIDEKNPVRVIRKLEGLRTSDVFVYDGLYVVSRYIRERSAQGNVEFKFYLDRVPGQPLLHKMLNDRFDTNR